ncbi:MAG: hypothetical protein KJ064_27525 [Anaerolineae bacterium]|nr:hypothetical protein [Anaerolineae bacterium]
MPPIFDSYRNLSEMLYDDPLLVFAVEALGAVITLVEVEETQPKIEPTTEEVQA